MEKSAKFLLGNSYKRISNSRQPVVERMAASGNCG
jgi:hypothetical protein